jgi:hypothetical protein
MHEFYKNLEAALKFQFALNVIWNKFSTKNTLKSGATIKNLVATATWRPEFVYPCIAHIPISANDLNH